MPKPPRTVHYCKDRLQAYQKFRFKHRMAPTEAWMASKDFDKVERWFGDGHMHPPYDGGFRGGTPFKSGSSMLTWCESPGDYLHCEGVYGDRPRADHNGWYLDDDFQDETAEGIVYRIRVQRRGHYKAGETGTRVRYIAGIKDPHNEGPAMLQLGETDWHDDLDDAFRDADGMAEKYAEREREYQAAWRLGNEAADLLNTAADDREECKKLVREINALKGKQDAAAMPEICSTLRARVKKLRSRIKSGVEKAKEIIDDVNSWSQEAFDNGFKDTLNKGVKVPV